MWRHRRSHGNPPLCALGAALPGLRGLQEHINVILYTTLGTCVCVCVCRYSCVSPRFLTLSAVAPARSRLFAFLFFFFFPRGSCWLLSIPACKTAIEATCLFKYHCRTIRTSTPQEAGKSARCRRQPCLNSSTVGRVLSAIAVQDRYCTMRRRFWLKPRPSEQLRTKRTPSGRQTLLLLLLLRTTPKPLRVRQPMTTPPP